jgi:hypothetical protein
MMKKGALVLEIMLAATIFVLFASGVVVGIVNVLNMNRNANERVVATNYAQEGLEALRSIKNQNYNALTLTAGTGVQLDGTSGLWEYNGAGNNTWGDYTRVLEVEAVYRDGSGNIAGSGTLDYNTKKITATVTWNFTSAKAQSVAITDYLTYWKADIGGIVVYGDGTNVPKYRNYGQPNDGFSAEGSLPTGAAGRNFIIRTSPIKHEAVAAYTDNTGTLRVLCYDGETWNSEWSVAVGGTGTTRRFDITYELTSGDVMVAYSRNAAAVNAVNYRTKPGTSGCGTANWAAATTVPTTTTLTSATVYWVRLERSPVAASNTIAMAWSDSASDLGAMIWSGSAWGNLPGTPLETNLEYAAAAGDVQSFDLAFESSSGEIMVAWGVLTTTVACTAGTNCMRYRAFQAGAWGAITAIPTVADSATSIDLAAAPNSNAIILAALDNGSVTANLDDLSTAYWSGSAWTGRANVDNTAGHPVAGSKLVAAGYLVNGATTRAVIAYMDASGTAISWYVCSGSAACSKQTDWTPSTGFTDPRVWIMFNTDPLNQNQLMYTPSDNASDLWGKRLSMTAAAAFTWTNSDAGTALETSLTQATSNPFSFAYWVK